MSSILLTNSALVIRVQMRGEGGIVFSTLHLRSEPKFLNKLLRSPGIDSKDSNPPAYVCILAGRYENSIPTRFLAPIDCLKIPAQYSWLLPQVKTGNVAGPLTHPSLKSTFSIQESMGGGISLCSFHFSVTF